MSPPFDKLKPMGEFPTRKHSDELVAAIVSASKRHTNAEIARQLGKGTLAQWEGGPYEIPAGTVAYFVRRHRNQERAGAHALHERATGDMHAALDGFGREIATELFEKLKHERGKKVPDIKKLAELATVAAKVKPLIKDTPAKVAPVLKAKDPFAAQLEASARASKPRKPKPAPSLEFDEQQVAAMKEQPVPTPPAWLGSHET